MKRLPFAIFVSGLTTILVLGAFWTSVVQADSKRKFTLEVAMGDPPSGVNLSGNPASTPNGRGILVLANGNIFPRGTLGKGPSGFDPTDTDGAIGNWHCQFVSLGTSPVTGAVTYFFRLYATGYDRGESMIMVQGLNSHPGGPNPDVEGSVRRVLAVVGGTGKYAGATGVVHETVIGTNVHPDTDATSRNLRFKFRLHRARHHGHDDDDDA